MRFQFFNSFDGGGQVRIGLILRWLLLGVLWLPFFAYQFLLLLAERYLRLDLVIQLLADQLLHLHQLLPLLQQQLQKVLLLILVQAHALPNRLHAFALGLLLLFQLQAAEMPLEEPFLVERVDDVVVGVERQVPLLQLVLRVELQEHTGGRVRRRLLKKLLETQDHHGWPAVVRPAQPAQLELLHRPLLPPQQHDPIQPQLDVVGGVFETIVVLSGDGQSPHETLQRVRYLEAVSGVVLRSCLQFTFILLQLADLFPQLRDLLLKTHVLLPQKHHFLIRIASQLLGGEDGTGVSGQVVGSVGSGRTVGLGGVKLAGVGEQFPDVGEIERGVLGAIFEFFSECPQGVESLAGDVRGGHDRLSIFYYCIKVPKPCNSSNFALLCAQILPPIAQLRDWFLGCIVARIIIGMLRKASTIRGLANTIRCLFSRESGEAKVKEMRETDYAAKRKSVIEEFNQQLIQQKALHNQQYQGYEKATKAARSETEAEAADKQFEQYLNKYYNHIEGLNAALRKQLEDIDHAEKTDIVKLYLLDNLPNDKQQPLAHTPRKDTFYIPNGLVLKKLYHGSRAKAKELHPSRHILLAGVEREEEHSLFLARLMDEMGVKNVVTMVSPDLPYFIKTERSYLQEWSKFIANNDYARKCKFYLNPQPKTLEDICLREPHIPLVRRGLARSRTFLESYYSMQQENDITREYEPAPLLTGLLSQGVSRVYFGNYPAFEERRMIADLTPLARLRELFHLHLSNYRAGRLHFSAQWLFPKEVLTRKLAHLAAVTRAAVESTNERTLLVCPAEMAELLAIEWQVGNGRLSYNYQDGHHYLNLAHKLEGAMEQSFVEFIEKLVILDLLTEPIFTRYFVKHRSFPFLCEHTIGGRENVGKIFAVWMHFYNTYYSLLAEKRLGSAQTEQQRGEYMNQFEHPTDFT